MSKTDKMPRQNPVIVRVLKALKKRKVLTYSELTKYGATGALLKKLSENGSIVPVGSGIYASSTLDPFVAAVTATTKYYPQTVISGITALQIHGLTEEYIQKIDVDIPREKSIRNRMLEVHRVPSKRLIGIVALPFQGKKIRIYDIERTLCEAYLADPKGSLFYKALKRYCALGKIDSDRIAQYDRVLKTEVLSHLRQELADG